MKKHNKYGAETRQEYKMLYMREWRKNHQQQSRDSAKRRYEARKARKAAEAAPIHDYSNGISEANGNPDD